MSGILTLLTFTGIFAGAVVYIALLVLLLSSSKSKKDIDQLLKTHCGKGCASCKINKCFKK